MLCYLGREPYWFCLCANEDNFKSILHKSVQLYQCTGCYQLLQKVIHKMFFKPDRIRLLQTYGIWVYDHLLNMWMYITVQCLFTLVKGWEQLFCNWQMFAVACGHVSLPSRTQLCMTFSSLSLTCCRCSSERGFCPGWRSSGTFRPGGTSLCSRLLAEDTWPDRPSRRGR